MRVLERGGPAALQADPHVAINAVKVEEGREGVPLQPLSHPSHQFLSILAGVVAEADPGCAFQPGRAVYGFKDVLSGRGCYAQYTVVKEGDLAAVPAGLPIGIAASVRLAQGQLRVIDGRG